MSKDFKLNSNGVRELLKSDKMSRAINGVVQSTIATAGTDFEGDTRPGKNRIWGVVKSSNYKGYRKCLKENTLLKALGGQHV